MKVDIEHRDFARISMSAEDLIQLCKKHLQRQGLRLPQPLKIKIVLPIDDMAKKHLPFCEGMDYGFEVTERA